MAQKRPIKEKIKLKILISLLKMFFSVEKHFVTIKAINYPEGQFILSILHGQQCMVYNIKDKENFYVLISASNDGEIISKAIECLNLKSIRGSSKRRAVAGSLELIDKLKAGSSAPIMIDGPRGPRGKVKDGIINIAKLTGVPIVPAVWGSKNKTFFEFNSWDKFKIPFGPCTTIALYGKPIYIPPETTKEEMKDWCIKIEEEIANLEKDLENNYESYLKQ